MKVLYHQKNAINQKHYSGFLKGQNLKLELLLFITDVIDWNRN